MENEEAREVLPGLEMLLKEITEYRSHVGDFLKTQTYRSEGLETAKMYSFAVMRALRESIATIKRERIAVVQESIVSWHQEQGTNPDESPDPKILWLKYDGDDTWTATISSSERGHQRLIVATDTYSYFQVISATP